MFAKEGHFDLSNNKRTLVLNNGYRYSGIAGRGDFDQVSFQELNLIINTTPKVVDPIDHRRTIPTAQLIGSSNPQYQAELMWRVSLPITVLLLSLLAIPLSYFNTRSGNSYHVLLAVGFFLVYQCGGRRQNQFLAGLAADAFADTGLHWRVAANALHARAAILAGLKSRAAGAITALPCFQAAFAISMQPENPFL